MSWKEHYSYVFPPFSTIAARLQKIDQDHATGVLVVPIWQAQPWFTTLLHLLVDYPLRLPQSNHLLMQPHNGALHPLRKQLNLMAWKLSGRVSNREMFQAKLLKSSSSSWSAGTQKQYTPYITQWFDFCGKRESNPYDPPLTAVLDFLVILHDKGLSYTTINTDRSAISAFFCTKE